MTSAANAAWWDCTSPLSISPVCQASRCPRCLRYCYRQWLRRSQRTTTLSFVATFNQGIRFFLILYFRYAWYCLRIRKDDAVDLFERVLGRGPHPRRSRARARLVGDWRIFGLSVAWPSGRVRVLGVIMATTTVLPVTAGDRWARSSRQAVGAAIAHGLISLANVLALYLLLRRRFGSVVRMQNIGRITVAGSAMVMVNVLCITSTAQEEILVGTPAGGLTYGITVLVLAELRPVDFAAFLRRTGTK